MIIGETESVDGGKRRITIRHTQLVDKEIRLKLISYLKEVIYQKCKEEDWVGSRDLYPNIPEDIKNTPLILIYNICREKFKETPDTIKINVSKYIGILVREAVYYSEVRFFEKIDGSVRKYSLESKKLKENLEE